MLIEGGSCRVQSKIVAALKYGVIQSTVLRNIRLDNEGGDDMLDARRRCSDLHVRVWGASLHCCICLPTVR